MFAICDSTSVIAEEITPTIVQGRIWTGVSQRPWAEAMAIKGNRIVAVGSRAEIAARAGAGARVIDAGDGIVVPGMCDSHIHLIEGGMHLSSVQLRDAATREEFVKRIGEFAAARRERGSKEWITGGDWDHTLWGGQNSENQLPDRAWIDAVTGDVPVWISRLDGHMALANSAALAAAGVTDDVADVEGGEIVRDGGGRLTGLLKDNAMALVERGAPAESLDRRLEAAVAAMKYLNAQGVTAE